MAIIHRIGTPENDSEARAIKQLAKELPDDCFVFHNFEVTTGRGLPYEYDIAPGGIVKLGNFELAFIPNAPNLSIARSVREHFDRRHVDPAVWENPSDVVPASDVYSPGLVFYQLITCQPPLHDVEAVLAGNGPAIDTEFLAAELSRSDSPNFMGDPAGAAEVIGRMCAPGRSDRYATLAEAMDDLALCEA
jgi:hypothetical protein